MGNICFSVTVALVLVMVAAGLQILEYYKHQYC